jgi:hypothetical protein
LEDHWSRRKGGSDRRAEATLWQLAAEQAPGSEWQSKSLIMVTGDGYLRISM